MPNQVDPNPNLSQQHEILYNLLAVGTSKKELESKQLITELEFFSGKYITIYERSEVRYYLK